MSQIRVNFLNWRPDIEATEHDGLSQATNVYHSPSGYKSTKLNTSGAGSTLTGLDGITILSTRALQVKAMGPGRTVGADNFASAYIREATGGSFNLSITENAGGDSLSSTLNATGTSMALSAFDTCALGNQVFICAQMDVAQTGGTLDIRGLSGTLDIS